MRNHFSFYELQNTKKFQFHCAPYQNVASKMCFTHPHTKRLDIALALYDDNLITQLYGALAYIQTI